MVLIRVFRVFYPIAVYLGITYCVSIAALVVIDAALLTAGFESSQAVRLVEMSRIIFNQNALLITCVSALAALPLLLYFFQRDRRSRGIAPGGKVMRSHIGYLIPLGISACIAGNNVITLSRIDRFFQGYREVDASLYASPVWLQLAGVGILIPIVEELTFRALGFRRLRDSMRLWPSAFISALCFAVFHGNVVQGVYAFFLGCLMAWVYERYENFVAPAVIHCVANLTSVAITITPLGAILYRNEGNVIWGAVIAAVVTAGLIRCVDEHVKPAYEREQKEENL